MAKRPTEVPDPLSSLPLARRAGYVLIKLGEVTLELAERTLVPLGLRARHFNLMAMVAADASLSQRDISDVLGLDPNIIVALVDDLEREGLLSRQRSARDRRRHVLTLTPEGQRVLAVADRRIDDAERELLDPLTGEEAEVLLGLAQRILAPRWPPERGDAGSLDARQSTRSQRRT